MKAVQAFEREATILAGLSHEHLPSVHDFFSDASRHHLVMEYVRGKTLEEKISEAGKLPVDEVVEIGPQVAETLELSTPIER